MAASLLDELLEAPRAPRLTLTLRVPGEAPSVSLPSVSPPAATLGRPDDTSAPSPLPASHRRDPYVEAGLLIAGVAYGAEVGGGLYLHQDVRLQLHATTSYVIFGAVGSALRASVADDDDGRFEIGADGGVVLAWSAADHARSFDDFNAGAMGGGYLGFSWGPLERVRIGFASAARRRGSEEASRRARS